MANCIEYLKEEGKFESMTDTAIAQEIVEDYVGTCHSLSSEDYDWLDENGFLEFVDEQIFECEVCGWWWEISDQGDSEKHNGMVCTDCVEDEND